MADAVVKRQLSREEIDNRFDYHPPKENQPQQYAAVRQQFKALALFIWEHIPEGREKNVVFTHLEEAHFLANAAIARRS